VSGALPALSALPALPWPKPLQSGDRVQLAAASSALLGDDALARL
jgi:hypothetical protein